MTDRADVVSSFTVIKGALVAETYEAFRHWNFEEDRRTNIARLKDLNVFGAQSTNWLRDLGKVLNRRFDPNGRDKPLVRLAQGGVDLEVWRPILLWHMTRDEFLVRDFLIHWLEPRFAEGVYRMGVEDVLPYLHALEQNGRTQEGKPWSEKTRKRVASGLLGIASDMGLLRGSAQKEFTSFHLPEDSFIYLLHATLDREANGACALASPDWQMYLYSSDDVEQELLRLHQFRRVHFERAGSVVSLSLPCNSAAEFAEEMCA